MSNYGKQLLGAEGLSPDPPIVPLLLSWTCILHLLLGGRALPSLHLLLGSGNAVVSMNTWSSPHCCMSLAASLSGFGFLEPTLCRVPSLTLSWLKLPFLCKHQVDDLLLLSDVKGWREREESCVSHFISANTFFSLLKNKYIEFKLLQKLI